MMRVLICAVLMAVSVSIPGMSYAGVKGYRVVFIDLTPAKSVLPVFLDYRVSRSLRSLSKCWSARKGDWIDIAYAKTQPIDMMPKALMSAATGEAASVQQLAELLTHYRDDQIDLGFDGAYLVAERRGLITITGVSRDGAVSDVTPLRTVSAQNLDQALCTAAAAFDRSFKP